MAFLNACGRLNIQPPEAPVQESVSLRLEGISGEVASRQPLARGRLMASSKVLALQLAPEKMFRDSWRPGLISSTGKRGHSQLVNMPCTLT